METRVSRKDLFGEPDSPNSPDEPETVALDFEEVEIDEPAEAIEENALGAFQLFGGQALTVIDLDAPEDEGPVQKRPDSYYFTVSGADSERCSLVAVTGEQILAHAALELAKAARRPPAPDINAGWVPPRRKCRPGKAARKHRKELNIRREQERKNERDARRFGGFRARGGRGGYRR